ncbi:hypothetical protein NPIL_473002 [Nephila pilipes]|nr:hypothetical protein NPIL_473002 [Nephila pilipes]
MEEQVLSGEELEDPSIPLFPGSKHHTDGARQELMPEERLGRSLVQEEQADREVWSGAGAAAAAAAAGAGGSGGYGGAGLGGTGASAEQVVPVECWRDPEWLYYFDRLVSLEQELEQALGAGAGGAGGAGGLGGYGGAAGAGAAAGLKQCWKLRRELWKEQRANA